MFQRFPSTQKKPLSCKVPSGKKPFAWIYEAHGGWVKKSKIESRSDASSKSKFSIHFRIVKNHWFFVSKSPSTIQDEKSGFGTSTFWRVPHGFIFL